MIEDDFPLGCVNVLVPWRVPSVKRREFRPRRLDLEVPSVFFLGATSRSNSSDFLGGKGVYIAHIPILV